MAGLIGPRSEPRFLQWLLWVGWCFACVAVLADLYAGRYRVIGPSVLGIAAWLGGALVVRYMARLGPSGEAERGASPTTAPANPVAARQPGQGESEGWGCSFISAMLLFSTLGTFVGLTFLLEPMQLNPPENASIAWTFPPGERPVHRPYIRWERIRSDQCTSAPILLFFGGLSTAVLWYWSRYQLFLLSGRRPGPSRVAPWATDAPLSGPHPGLIVFVVWLLLILVSLKI